MAEQEKEEVVYTESTAARDLKDRLGTDKPAPVFMETVNPGSEDSHTVNEDGFVGVDPIYQNAANKTDEPLAAEEEDSADALAEQAFDDSYGDGTDSGAVAKTYGEVTRPDIDGVDKTESASSESEGSSDDADSSVSDDTSSETPAFGSDSSQSSTTS